MARRVEDVNVLDGGMESGLHHPHAHQAADQWRPDTNRSMPWPLDVQIVTLAKILMAKYPSLMLDDAHAKDKDILGMLQELRSRATWTSTC